MSAPKGYSSQEKDDRLSAQFATVEPVRTLQNGLTVISNQFVFEVATDATEAGTSTTQIVAAGHAALKGDVILISGQELRVWDVSANTIIFAETLSSAPSNGTSFKILRDKLWQRKYL